MGQFPLQQSDSGYPSNDSDCLDDKDNNNGCDVNTSNNIFKYD